MKMGVTTSPLAAANRLRYSTFASVEDLAEAQVCADQHLHPVAGDELLHDEPDIAAELGGAGTYDVFAGVLAGLPARLASDGGYDEQVPRGCH
jgi:hypothetical protein